MSSNREAWLTQAVERFREGLFAPNGITIPPVRVSVGFAPGKLYKKLPGKCLTDTTDKIPQIYINPTIDNAVRALEVLGDMLTNAHPCALNHADMTRIGYQLIAGAWVATPALKEELELLAEELGAYPHSSVHLKDLVSRKGGLNTYQCKQCASKFYFSNAVKAKLSDATTTFCPIDPGHVAKLIKEAGR